MVGAGSASGTGSSSVAGTGLGVGVATPPPLQNGHSLSPNSGKYRSRSPTPQRKFLNQQTNEVQRCQCVAAQLQAATNYSSNGFDSQTGRPSCWRMEMEVGLWPGPETILHWKSFGSRKYPHENGTTTVLIHL